MRPSGRAADEMRSVSIETGVNRYAEGSCLIRFGETHVHVTASIEEKVPAWMRNSRQGWITAEYGMLPRATNTRTMRETGRGPSGRTQEIQRLIGRSLRAATNLAAMGEIQMRIDCDVLQADGGTRTASVTGAYVAAHLAFGKLIGLGAIKVQPLRTPIAAVSCGIYKGQTVLDPDYAEDSAAETDANFVLSGNGGIVEVQGTAEKNPFTEHQLIRMLGLATAGCKHLFDLQRTALGAS